MSTERPSLPGAIGFLSLLLVTTALSAQQPAAREAALLALVAQQNAQSQTQQTAPTQQTAQPQTRTDEPQQPTGAPEAPAVPDQLPGEPPPLIDEGDPGIDEVDEAQLGSFFLTSFAFASAYDELRSNGSAAPIQGDAVGGPEDMTVNDGGEIAYLFRPTFLFVHKPDTRGSLVLAYEPEIETLQDQDEERVSHSAGLTWDRRMTRRTDLTAGASYIDSLDPTRHLGGEGFVLIPGRFEQTRAYFGASHLWPRATRIHFYSEYATAQSELNSSSPALDVSDVSGTVALEQGIGRHSDFTLSYSYTETDLETVDAAEPAPTRFSGPIDSVRAGFGHDLGKVSFHISAGAMREQAQEGDLVDATGNVDDDITWIGAAEVARETDTMKLRLRYDRSLFAFGYGDSSIPSGVEGPLADGAALRDTVADTLSFFIELLPHNRVRLEQSLWLSRESLIEGDNVDSFVTGTLLEVLLTGRNVHRLMLFSRFDYYDRDESALLGEALSRTRFSLGFRVGLTGPQTKVGQRLAVDELRKVLPSGGRL